ncbi:MAG: helix-turn-helix transcriptional regulator [Deltaproteobacteria bacterium]|nr:helix-turn-helix transcriptional regulator [Deltaproteobacteria bacterium]
MSIAKYFWDLKEENLKETERILKNPKHSQFTKRMVTILSRCDKPKELFSIISRKKFVETWPKIRIYWMKHTRWSEFRDWWETIYEQIIEQHQKRSKKIAGEAPASFREIGRVIKETRIEKGHSQKQLAHAVNMKQPDVSKVEEGKKNVTLFTLIRLCKTLGIKRIDIS